MALKIGPTPILSGKDAARFLHEVQSRVNEPLRIQPSPNIHESIRRAVASRRCPMKLKILYRKNLNMSPGKLAAQCVHAACLAKATGEETTVVLGVSDTKFEQHRPRAVVVVADAGLTEVAPGTETCMAFFE